MTDALELPLEPPRCFQFNWLFGALFTPRSIFAKIAAQNVNVWLTPLLVLTLTTLGRVIMAGWLNQQAAAMGTITYPPGFEYYTAEQQAQFLQAMQATQGPVFAYVLPAFAAIMGVWIGWLFVGGLLHLLLTLLGGRGVTSAAMNVVAWASLPFALRDGVRFVYMLATRQTIARSGLSGLTLPEGGASVFFAGLLALVDVYLVWHIVLIVVGVRAGGGVTRGKAIFSAVATVLSALLLQALLVYAASRLGDLSITRPFFF